MIIAFWGVGGAIAFGVCGGDRFWDVEGRSLVGNVGMRSLLGMREGDRFLGCGRAIAVWDLRGDRFFWGCKR